MSHPPHLPPLLSLIGLLCLSPPLEGQAGEWDLRRPEYGPSADLPRFWWVTDRVSEVAGLGRLREVALPEGTRELRLWVGFGIGIPHEMLRLVDDGRRVTGELFHWWSSPERLAADPRFDDFREDQRTRAGRFGCIRGVARSAGGVIEDPAAQEVPVGVCRLDFRGAEPDWSRFLRRVEELGVFTLPRAETLSPHGAIVVDGISLQVEVLVGGRYRTYTYGNPGRQPWPEAEKAAAILDAFEELRNDAG